MILRVALGRCACAASILEIVFIVVITPNSLEVAFRAVAVVKGRALRCHIPIRGLVAEAVVRVGTDHLVTIINWRT